MPSSQDRGTRAISTTAALTAETEGPRHTASSLPSSPRRLSLLQELLRQAWKKHNQLALRRRLICPLT